MAPNASADGRTSLVLVFPGGIRKWTALVGEMLIMLALGTTYTFGNLSPYFTSYLRMSLNDTSIHYSSTSWVNSLAAIGRAGTMPLSGYLEDKMGVRLASLLGCSIFTVGVFLSCFTVRWSFYAFAVTYGLLFGVGTGIAYPICLACSIRWFPSSKGTITGVTLLGFGLSSFVFNILQTFLINPTNLSPDVADPWDPSQKFFTQAQVLQRVPDCFMILAGIYAVMQLVGVALINSPTQHLAQHPAPKDVASESDPLLSEGSAALYSETDVKPSQVLRSKHFYLLYVIFGANSLTVNFIATLYKAFGQTFIANDFYLTAIGSLSSVFNAAGRIVWGFVADRTSNKFALVTISCLGAALLFSLVVCAVLTPWVYLVWICLIFFVSSGQFAVCPAAVAKLYGSRHFPTNYGLLYTAGVLSAIMSASMTMLLLQSIGWFGLFVICGALYVFGALAAFLFRASTPEGLEV